MSKVYDALKEKEEIMCWEDAKYWYSQQEHKEKLDKSKRKDKLIFKEDK
tara:strand:- start:1426 stop:1572 length:147 start_codon:yes stop_codon:yes gene_type:complete